MAVNSASSLEEIVQTVIERVDTLLQYDRASIALADPTGTHLEVRDISLHEPGQPVREIGKRIPINEANALGWATLHGKANVKGVPEAAGEFQSVQSSEEPASHVIAPIVGREKTLGVLCIGAFREHAFGDNEVTVIQNYARLVGVAIENLQNYQQTIELSIRDGLTGCFNHRHFNEVLQRESSRADRYSESLSLLMLDVDHFKRFNDEFGHQAGDQVLIQTCALIERVARASDMLFRYGGEEFCLLLPATDSDGAIQTANKILDDIREHNYYRPDRTRAVSVHLSIGIATAPRHATSPEALIACADQALYSAKDAGRDRALLFEDSDEINDVSEALEAAASDPETKLSLGHTFPLNAHSMRVAQFAQLASANTDLSEEQMVNLQIAAFFHDLGESTISKKVIEKQGKLGHDERRLIQTHPVVGAGILQRSIGGTELVDAVLYHHERYDGTGYPKGLEGEEIPILARILAIAEVFDALVTERPYRTAVSPEAAYSTLREVAGYQLDPDLVEDFIAAHTVQQGGTTR